MFTNQQCYIKNGAVRFPKKLAFEVEVKTRLSDTTTLREVRIIPKGVGYMCEIVYQKVIPPQQKPDNTRIADIDLGVSNVITMVNSIGEPPIVVKDDGTGIKSINQFYQKEKARLRSIYDRQGITNGNKMKRLEGKYERKSNNYTHKLSRRIVNWCVQYGIGKLVIGYNPEWKQQVELGKRTNQNFMLIPYLKIIHQVRYKAEEEGVAVELVEESYTSKCSFLDNEPMAHQQHYVGRRVKRGLFRSAQGILINADVNGGYNIIRKSEPNVFTRVKADGVGGCFGLHPVRWNLTADDEIARSNLSHTAQIS